MNLKDLKKQYNSITPDPDLNSQARSSLITRFENTCPNAHTSFVDDFLRLASRCVKPAMVTINTILIIGVLTFGLYLSSANATPGDFLYPVKLSFEKARINILAKESSQNALRAEVLHERLSEAELLAKKLNANDTNLNAEFNILAQSFVKELDNLKKDIKEDMRKQGKETDKNKVAQITTQQEKDQNKDYFPDEKLLSEQSEYLPVADGKEIHPFNHTNLKEFQNVVSDIKESLKNKDMQAALNQIEKAKSMVSQTKNNQKDSVKENKDENKDDLEKENVNEMDEKENTSDQNTEQENKAGKDLNQNIKENNNINNIESPINDKNNQNEKSTASLGSIPKEKETNQDTDFQTGKLEKNAENSFGIGEINLKETE